MNSPAFCPYCSASLPLSQLGPHLGRLHLQSGAHLSWPCTDCSFAATALDAGLAHCLLAGHGFQRVSHPNETNTSSRWQGRKNTARPRLFQQQMTPEEECLQSDQRGRLEPKPSQLSSQSRTSGEVPVHIDLAYAPEKNSIIASNEINHKEVVHIQSTTSESTISFPDSIEESFSLDTADSELISEDFSALLAEDESAETSTNSEPHGGRNKRVGKTQDKGFKEPGFSAIELHLPAVEKMPKEKIERGKGRVEKRPLELHCSRCDATLRCDTDPTRAMRHALSCLNIRPFACSVCGQDSARRSTLSAHIKSRKNKACTNALVVMVNEKEDKAAAKEALRLCFPAEPEREIILR